jgi:hypothetical protein
MPLPNLHIADICNNLHELSMQIADFFGKM